MGEILRDFEDGGIAVLRNVGTYLRSCTMSHSTVNVLNFTFTYSMDDPVSDSLKSSSIWYEACEQTISPIF
jgi:hypothetical protein